MVGKQHRFLNYEGIVNLLKKEHNINLGSSILVPAVNGRKQKKRTDYATIVDVVMKQSGEAVILCVQRNKKLLFTIEELEKCWSRNPAAGSRFK